MGTGLLGRGRLRSSVSPSEPELLLGWSGHAGQEPPEYTQCMAANVDITPGRTNV